MALVGGGQFACHLLLTALAGHADDHHTGSPPAQVVPPPAAAAPGAWTGSLYDLTMGAAGHGDATTLAAPHWFTHVVDDLSGSHALMAIAHLIAATLVALWLATGEQALWTLLALLGTAALRVLTRLIPCDSGENPAARGTIRPGASHACGHSPGLTALVGGHARRGPPVAAA